MTTRAVVCSIRAKRRACSGCNAAACSTAAEVVIRIVMVEWRREVHHAILICTDALRTIEVTNHIEHSSHPLRHAASTITMRLIGIINQLRQAHKEAASHGRHLLSSDRFRSGRSFHPRGGDRVKMLTHVGAISTTDIATRQCSFFVSMTSEPLSPGRQNADFP